MKYVGFIALLLFLDCSLSCNVLSNLDRKQDSRPALPQVNKTPSGIAPDLSAPGYAKVDRYELELRAVGEKCVLRYSSDYDNGEILMDVPSPCEFVRKVGSGEAGFFKYRHPNGTYFAALLVTAGPVHPTISDKLMPQGCGTQLQGIHVFDYRVTLQEKSSADDGLPVMCPTSGADESMFGSF